MSIVRTRIAGLAVVFVATLLWSTVGLFVRLSGLDSWSIVLWRSLFGALALAPLWLAATRHRAPALRLAFSGPGLIAIGFAVAGNVTYIAALNLTSVATVMTVYAALPFVTGGLGFLLLGEALSRRFAVAALVAGTGIIVTAGAALSGAGPAGTGATNLAGIAMAVLMTVSWGGLLVQAKRYPALDLTLISLVSALGAVVVSLPMVPAGLSGPVPPPAALVACALLGVLTCGLANVLTLMGGRYIRAGETGLLLLLDVVLAPLWVWLAFGEALTTPELLGGALVVAAVAGYLTVPTRRVTARCPAP